MKVQLAPDFPVNDESCKVATGKTFAEWWIPAEDLPELNANIVGLIEVLQDAAAPD